MFSTTHTGSLPRPDDLSQMLYDREDRKPTPDLERRVAETVTEVVRQQVDAGVDVVNDGEMGKIGYSTYVKDRLSGFEVAAEPSLRAPLDLTEFPDLQAYRRPVNPAIRYAYSIECTGDIRPRDTRAVEMDIDGGRRAPSRTPCPGRAAAGPR